MAAFPEDVARRYDAAVREIFVHRQARYRRLTRDALGRATYGLASEADVDDLQAKLGLEIAGQWAEGGFHTLPTLEAAFRHCVGRRSRNAARPILRRNRSEASFDALLGESDPGLRSRTLHDVVADPRSPAAAPERAALGGITWKELVTIGARIWTPTQEQAFLAYAAFEGDLAPAAAKLGQPSGSVRQAMYEARERVLCGAWIESAIEFGDLSDGELRGRLTSTIALLHAWMVGGATSPEHPLWPSDRRQRTKLRVLETHAHRHGNRPELMRA